MSASGRASADAIVRACIRLERSRIDVPAGIQGGLLSLLVVVASLVTGKVTYGIPLAIGVLFVAICDVPDANRIRLRSMLWGTLWCAAATFMGGVVGSSPVLHVAVAFGIAAVCGYALALGMRGGLIGTISLVLFAVFAGAPVSTGIAAVDAACVIAGGALTILVTVSIWPLRRFRGVRGALARTYRLFAETTHKGGLELAAPIVAVEAMNTKVVIGRSGFSDTSEEWFRGLLHDLERARIAFIGLLAQRTAHGEYVEAVIASTSATSASIARAIMRPRTVRQARAALDGLENLCRAAPSPEVAVVVGELCRPLADAIQRLEGVWPLGRRSETTRAHIEAPSAGERLRQHWKRTDVVFEHAIRLSVAFGVATLVSETITEEHSYWLPMTVAWVAKPDLAGTVNRVAMRVVGTIVGLLIFGVIAMVTTNPYVLAVVAAIAAYLLVAYIWANYPIAVVGVTIFVIALMQLSGGEPLIDMVARMVATIVAGAWVLLVSLFRPRRAGATVVASIERTVTALRDYADAVRDGNDRGEARARLLRERTAALAIVTAVGSEPRGLWEREGPRIDADAGAQLMERVLDATALVVSEDLLSEHGMGSPEGWNEIARSLTSIEHDVATLSP